jgi:hypothetical protein
MTRTEQALLQNQFFSATICEEQQGRQLPQSQLRLISQDPAGLGKSIVKILQSRFFVFDPAKIQRVSKLKIILVDLEKSYLVIRIDTPNYDHVQFNFGHYFTRIYKTIISSIVPPKSEPLLRRLPPSNAHRHSNTLPKTCSSIGITAVPTSALQCTQIQLQ